ncbi:MAG: hypothetical protein LIP77_07975, partial [Planctomycetes bacterium]|nr:hypothetical protein [Planctomycetota bacterium]
TLEQSRDRELAPLDRERREVEANWLRQRDILKDDRADNADRAEVRAERKDVRVDRKEAEKAYKAAIRSLDDRKKLIERKYAQKFEYFDDRDNIRRDFRAGMPNNPEFRDVYRRRLRALEDSRIDNERRLHNDLTGLAAAMPPAYRSAPAKEMVETRRTNLAHRHEAQKARIENRWGTVKGNLEKNIAELDKRLADPNITAENRELYTKMRTDMQARLNSRREMYDTSLKAIDERKTMTDEYMKARTDYIAKRDALLKEMRAKDLSDRETESYDKKLEDLDRDWERTEHRYHERRRPVTKRIMDGRTARSTRHLDPATAYENRARRYGGMLEGDRDRIAGTKVGEDAHGAYETVKEGAIRLGDAIADGFHEIVDRLED